MLKNVIGTVLSTVVLFSGLVQAQETAAPAAPGYDIPEVVARVGGVEIMANEYKQQVSSIMQSRMPRGGAQFPGQFSPEPTEQDFQLAMNSLVDQKIILKLAKKSTVTIEDTEVDAEVEALKQRFSTLEEFEAILTKEGLTIDGLKERLRASMLVNKFMFETLTELTKDLDTSDAALMVRYEELMGKGQLNKPAMVDVAHILAQVPQGTTDEKSWADAKLKMEAARERVVEGGEDFGVVAGEVTDDPGSQKNGGLYSNITAGKFVPEFDERMFVLPIGEVSDVFKTAHGWHILRVAKRSDVGVLAFEEVKDAIKGEKEGLAKKEAFTTFIADAKKGVKVEVFYEKAKTPQDPA